MKFLKGTYTAIITPFIDDNKIDWKTFEVLVERQIKAGVNGIVFVGTTGESPTLSHTEHSEILKWSVKIVKGRCSVIHSVGSNNTLECLGFARTAADAGADGIMAVNPYYNKPSQEGLFQHFKKIADETNLPLMLYNIKGRTAVNLETRTLLRLCEHKNIVAVKEASGDFDQMLDVISSVPKDFSVLSGDDPNILPFIAAGGDGVISVISNAIPYTLTNLVNCLLDGKIVESRDKFYEVYKFMKKLLSLDVNPIPIKELLHQMGYGNGYFRLPLVRTSILNIEKIKELKNIVEKIENN